MELGLAVFVYVGMPGPLWPISPNNPEHLDEVALGFPDLTIIAHHIGDPWNQMAVRLAARHRNLHLCTSAWSPRRYPAELLEFMAGKWHGTFGADKVIFGTDYPLLNLEKACRDARELDLPDRSFSASCTTMRSNCSGRERGEWTTGSSVTKSSGSTGPSIG